MVSLGLPSESGAALGAVQDPSLPAPMAQQDLVVVTLPLQHVPQLNAFLLAVSDPNSPTYAQFLTNAQFAQAFGPPATAQLGVANYLTAHGLTIEYLSSDHLTVAAKGTLQQLEQAFSVQFQMFTKGGQTFFAPTSSPSVPSSLAPWIEDVVGLTNSNFGTQAQLTYEPQLAVRGDASNGPGVGVEDYPNQNTFEFQLNPLWNATGNKTAGVHPSYAQGVVIATALWDLNNSPPPAPQYCPYSITDVLQFFHGNTTSGPSMPSELPAPIDHANYNVTGDPTQPPGTGECTDFSSPTGPNTATEELTLEMTIDQEYSGEDAPGAMIEPTYVGGDGVTVSDADLALLLAWIANGSIPNLAALSQSFGGSETPSWEVYYTELAAKGVTVLASSGDDNGACGFECNGEAVCDTGAAGEYSWNTEGATTINYPGSSPNVLSVGGSANMAYGTPSEPEAGLPGQTVWNWCPTFDNGANGGSTGGVSSDFAEPAYQSAIPLVNKAMLWAINVTNTGNFTTGPPPTGCEGCDDGDAYSATSARAIPDVAGPAADMTGYLGEQWISGWGGTSFSSPATAGAVGSIIAFDGHKLGFLNTALYQLESEYLSGDFAGLPFDVAPTYFVQNYSNAFFDGGTYNTSAGWGVPQAYNIALLLGKPFISTNPDGAASAGTTYPVKAVIKDDRSLSHVNVTYLEPGGTWANASLSLASGTLNSGTWTGSIPAPPQAGVLEYCIDAVDSGQGNSWSPYNQSAWVATGGKNLHFGCAVPFSVLVHVNPKIAVTPSQGPIGATVTVAGVYFSPSSTLTSLVVDTVRISSCTIGSLTTNSHGAFTCTFSVPSGTSGTTVTATDVTGAAAKGKLTVTALDIKVSPTKGTVGSKVTVSGTGFSVSSTVSLVFDGVTVSSCTTGSLTTGTTGAFTCTFSVPSGTVGTTVRVTDVGGSYALAKFTVT
jgi:hypothetical protein